MRADDKHQARLNVIRDMLAQLEYKNQAADFGEPDPNIVFAYEPEALKDGRVAE